MRRWVAMMGALGLLVGCGDSDSSGSVDSSSQVDTGDAKSDAAVDAASDAKSEGDADAGSDPDSDSQGTDSKGTDSTPSDADAGGLPELPVLVAEDGESNFAVAAQGWYRGDLHYHTNYSGDALKQGGDPIDVCIAIADYYRHPDFVGAFPNLAGNGLDFIAITDHRTDEGLTDPGFTHDHLILLPGEEYGGSGHACIWGLKEHITNSPVDGESENERHNDAIAEAHAQGALFSVNHPVQDNNWVWDTPEIDAIEVVNGPWAAFYQGSSQQDFDDGIASGVENGFIRDAFENGGIGHGDKALRFWQNHLTAGIHVPAVGGSDRHMLSPAGLPTTYVRKPAGDAFDGLDGPALGMEGILEGIRQGGTFVSRSPFGPQVELTAVGPNGQRYPMGAGLPPADSYDIEVRVSRAAGGRVRLIAGPRVAADENGRFAAQPEVVWEAAIDSELAGGSFTWSVPSEGAWLHAVVLEPLVVEELNEALQVAHEEFQIPREGNALLVIADALIPLIDPNLLLAPEKCDPSSWVEQSPQCITVDSAPPLATFHFPDAIVRLVNIWFEDGQPTEWAFGALSSAFLVEPLVQ